MKSFKYKNGVWLFLQTPSKMHNGSFFVFVLLSFALVILHLLSIGYPL